MGAGDWTNRWACVGGAAVIAALACPLLAIGHLHGAFPTHTDFSGHASGSGSSAPLFVFAGIALVDGVGLAVVYASDRHSRRLPAAFWFLAAVAMWWLVSAQAGFVAAALGVRGIPWLAINGIALALFAFAIVLLLIGAFRKLFQQS